MESKIIFLIVALLAIYLLFTETGQTWSRRYLGIDIQKQSKGGGGNFGGAGSSGSY